MEKIQRLPAWAINKEGDKEKVKNIKNLLRKKGLNTVCVSALCPNIGECFSRSTVTLMILGEICTRGCSFCGVNKGVPQAVNSQEPEEIINLIRNLGIKYLVITSVTRDDLPDGGAGHYQNVLRAIENFKKDTEEFSRLKIEILTPDFNGSFAALEIILTEAINVFAHNLETIPRLYPQVRQGADYQRSLELLKFVKNTKPDILTKSGIMLGLGETNEEVWKVMEDLVRVGCDILTIGQYLRPSRSAYPVFEYVHPEIFKDYEKKGKRIGFKKVIAGPLVRSSYRSREEEKRYA